MTDLAGRLYISTIEGSAAELARTYGFGLEIAEFCTAFNMDTNFEVWDEKVKSQMSGVNRFIFHAPYNGLCPAAIDPMIAEVAEKRYTQAYNLMGAYGINTMIVHSGFMPQLYDEGWFIEKSVPFWERFLSDKPDGFKLYMENVFEQTPGMLCEIARDVGDKRFKLCIDTGHMTLAGKAAPAGEWLREALPFTGHVHLHNNDGKSDLHNPPGDGIADVAAYIREITKSAPSVTFTLETRDGKESVRWLTANGFLGGGHYE